MFNMMILGMEIIFKAWSFDKDRVYFVLLYGVLLWVIYELLIDLFTYIPDSNALLILSILRLP